MTMGDIRLLPSNGPARPTRPTVVWWWERERDIDVPRLRAIRWTELDGARSGLIRVPARDCDPADPSDMKIPMEIQLQTALHFSGPIHVQHATDNLTDLAPVDRLRASGHHVVYRQLPDTQEDIYRGGVTAVQDASQTTFTIVISDDLRPAEEDHLADWAWTMIETFKIEGPTRWTERSPGQWQILARKMITRHDDER